MSKKKHYWVEITLQAISKQEKCSYNSLKMKGYFYTEKKYLDTVIKSYAESAISDISKDNPDVKAIKWKASKPKLKHIDFIIDPAQISIPLK
ncbi:MAG: hypothetical protein ACRC77_11295 [Bacteroidales bacterium]